MATSRTQQQQQPMQELEREYREQITRNIAELAQAQRVTQEAVQHLQVTMAPRSELKEAIQGTVDAGVYASDKAATEQRIQRLESAPMRAREWVVAALAGVGVLVSLTIGCGGMGVSLLIYLLSHGTLVK